MRIFVGYLNIKWAFLIIHESILAICVPKASAEPARLMLLRQKLLCFGWVADLFTEFSIHLFTNCTLIFSALA